MSAAAGARRRGWPRARIGLLVPPALLLVLGPVVVALALDRGLERPWVVLAIAVAMLPLLTPLVARLAGVPADGLLLAPAWMLCALGVTSVARVEPELLGRQLLWIALGWTAFVAVIAIPDLTARLRRYKYTWLFGGILLASATLVFGHDPNGSGSRLWLRLGPLTVQPSEVLRVLLIVFLAAYLDERGRLLTAVSQRFGPLRLPRPAYLLPLLLMAGLSVLVMVVQRDLGPSLLYVVTFLAMLYAATGRASYVLLGLLLFLAGAAAGYAVSDHVQARVDVWLDPWSDPRGGGFQSLQAIGGLASGGIIGTGPGYGQPSLVPAAHTDYPLAVIGEEWGLLGGLAVIALYAMLTVRALGLTLGGPRDGFERLLGAGIAVSLGLQVLIVLGGTLRLIPLTGLTSPFLSYGGSSMVMGWVSLGLLAWWPRAAPPPATADDILAAELPPASG